jgi:DNA-binding CsgD family transcriptional regulator
MTASLTRREIEVLTRVAQGETARQVALSLGITKRTVAAHMQSICEKLNSTNGAQAVAIAVTLDLIQP